MGCGHFAMEPIYSPPLPETKLASTWMMVTVCMLLCCLGHFNHFIGGGGGGGSTYRSSMVSGACGTGECLLVILLNRPGSI